MTPKQYVKYIKWLEKNNLAICDGSTVEPITYIQIVHNALIIGGLIGVIGAIEYKIRGKK